MNSPPLEIKRVKRRIGGVLLLDKPLGISSNQALQTAKAIFAARKGGHTGTLDPMATGLLAICFGEATKFSSELLGADKTYEATLRLGYVSTTGDAEGEIFPAPGMPMENSVPSLSLQEIDSVRKRFIGGITQVPPMFSALKHRGKPMYAYAREGMEVERTPRTVHIRDLSLEKLADDEMRLRVRCGTGTYIRTLADDMAKALGCGGAYLTSLRRTTLGDFQLAQAVTLEALGAMTPPLRDSCLLPVDSLLQNLPAVVLDTGAAALLAQGQTIADETEMALDAAGGCHRIRLYDRENYFLGMGEAKEGRIIPKRLVNR